MVYELFARLARLRVTLAYAVALSVITTTLLELGPVAQERVMQHASTNLHNLSQGHLGTLIASAFVVDAGPLYGWLPGLVCLLMLVEMLWGSWRLMVSFLVGHVGATLLVAVGLVAAVKFDWLPGEVTRATDVGMSYGSTAVLGALTPAVLRRWRPTWIGWWLGVGAAVVVMGRDFTDVGHATALVLGMLVASRFGRPRGWTATRFALLAVGSVFGYLVVTSDAASIGLVTAWGASGAVLGLMGTLLGAVRRTTMAVQAAEGCPAAPG